MSETEGRDDKVGLLYSLSTSSLTYYSSERHSTPREIRATSGVWLDSLNQPTYTKVRILLGMLLDELEEANALPEIRYFRFRVTVAGNQGVEDEMYTVLTRNSVLTPFFS